MERSDQPDMLNDEGGSGADGHARSNGEMPRPEASAWRERAAFRVAFDSRVEGGDRTVWQTRAYREETDTQQVWPGLAGDELLRWMIATADLPEAATPPTSPAEAESEVLPAQPAEAEPEPPAQPTEAESEVLPAQSTEAEPEPPAGPAAVEQAPAPDNLAAPEAAALQAANAPEEYAGPTDDLQQIHGIGAVIARRLGNAGIRSYEQLAQAPPSYLAQIAGVATGLVARQGWVEQARMLVLRRADGAAPVEGGGPAEPPVEAIAEDQSPALEPPLEETRPDFEAESAAMPLVVELLLDEDGDVREQRLLRAGEEPAATVEWAEGRVARFFVDRGAWREAGMAAIGGLLSEVGLEVDDLVIAEMPGLGLAQPRLRARAAFRLSGLGAELVADREPRYLANLLSYNLTSGETRVLRTVDGRLQRQSLSGDLTLDCDLPDIGRYQLLLAIILPEDDLLGVGSGPRLRVNP